MNISYLNTEIEKLQKNSSGLEGWLNNPVFATTTLKNTAGGRTAGDVGAVARAVGEDKGIVINALYQGPIIRLMVNNRPHIIDNFNFKVGDKIEQLLFIQSNN